MPNFPFLAYGPIQYLGADVTLTGALATVFGIPTEPGIRYEIEAQLYVNLSGAGIVTTSLGVTGQTPTIRVSQLAEASAATALKSAAGTGDQVIPSGSIATGVHSLIVRGSLSPVAGGSIFLAVSTGGAGLLVVGSTFRVWRSEA